MKKVMKKVIISSIVIGSLLLGGCGVIQRQYAIDTARIAADATLLASEFDTVANDVTTAHEQREIFSPEDWKTLLDSRDSINLLIKRYKNLGNMNFATMDVQTAAYMWSIASGAYKDARTVIVENESKFNAVTWRRLEAFDTKASREAERIEQLLSNPSYENINQAISLISTVLSIAIKVAGVAVL